MPMRTIFFQIGSLLFLWCLPLRVSGSAPCPRIGSVVTLCLRVCHRPRIGSAVTLSDTHCARVRLVTFSGTHCVRVGSTVAGSQDPPFPVDRDAVTPPHPPLPPPPGPMVLPCPRIGRAATPSGTHCVRLGCPVAVTAFEGLSRRRVPRSSLARGSNVLLG